MCFILVSCFHHVTLHVTATEDFKGLTTLHPPPKKTPHWGCASIIYCSSILWYYRLVYSPSNTRYHLTGAKHDFNDDWINHSCFVLWCWTNSPVLHSKKKAHMALGAGCHWVMVVMGGGGRGLESFLKGCHNGEVLFWEAALMGMDKRCWSSRKTTAQVPWCLLMGETTKYSSVSVFCTPLGLPYIHTFHAVIHHLLIITTLLCFSLY